MLYICLTHETLLKWMPNIFTFILLYTSNLFYNLFYTYIDPVYSVVFSPNGKYLATGSDDKTVNLLDIESKTIYHKFDNIHSGNNHK